MHACAAWLATSHGSRLIFPSWVVVRVRWHQYMLLHILFCDYWLLGALDFQLGQDSLEKQASEVDLSPAVTKREKGSLRRNSDLSDKIVTAEGLACHYQQWVMASCFGIASNCSDARSWIPVNGCTSSVKHLVWLVHLIFLLSDLCCAWLKNESHAQKQHHS